MKTRPTSGFTLIEMLVVLAISAILAAILFPVFAQAREMSHKIGCLSNMSQILKAHLMYVQDNDDTFSPNRLNSSAGGSHETGPDGHTWRVGVLPYLKSVDVSLCPSNPRTYDSEIEGYLERKRGLHISYAYNGDMFNAPSGTPLASISRTAGVMALLESRAPSPDLGDWCYQAGQCRGLTAAFQTHQKVSNWGFVDGHIKAMSHLEAAGSGLTSIWRDEEPPYGAVGFIDWLKSYISQVPEYR